MSAISQLGVGSVPRWANWEYATAAARTGASGFVATDIGKIAKQLDTGTFWELTAVAPTWAQVGGGSNIQLDITINAEAGDSIQIDIQVQDSSGNNISAIYGIDAWLSDNASDGSISATAPDGGFYASSAYQIFEYVADLMKKFVTDDTGALSVFVDESSVATWYLVIQMPDGTLTVSNAITFA